MLAIAASADGKRAAPARRLAARRCARRLPRSDDDVKACLEKPASDGVFLASGPYACMVAAFPQVVCEGDHACEDALGKPHEKPMIVPGTPPAPTPGSSSDANGWQLDGVTWRAIFDGPFNATRVDAAIASAEHANATVTRSPSSNGAWVLSVSRADPRPRVATEDDLVRQERALAAKWQPAFEDLLARLEPALGERAYATDWAGDLHY